MEGTTINFTQENRGLGRGGQEGRWYLRVLLEENAKCYYIMATLKIAQKLLERLNIIPSHAFSPIPGYVCEWNDNGIASSWHGSCRVLEWHGYCFARFIAARFIIIALAVRRVNVLLSSWWFSGHCCTGAGELSLGGGGGLSYDSTAIRLQ